MLKEMMNPEYQGQTLTIDLSKWGYKDYVAECIYRFHTQNQKYSLSIWLSRNDIEEKMRIFSKKTDTQYISGTKETIVENICRIVHQACLLKYFDRFVERYEYELLCFECGNQLFEQER